MDIHSGGGYPGSALSNFAPHPFVFDGVQCNSMEGLLQAFKFDKVHMQIAVCLNVGMVAKKRGSGRSKTWQRKQTLWWAGKTYDRHGQDYQEVLDRAYFDGLASNTKFVSALLATGQSTLTHSIGKTNPSETVLTRSEFCSRLTSLRSTFQLGIDSLDRHG